MSSKASPARKESSKIGQGVLEMSSSLPSSSGIQVIISPDPSQSHSHTPPFKDTSTAASLQDENIGLNEMTPPIDLASLKVELYIFALKDNWERAKSIFDEFPHMIPMELTVNGDTALHVAARSKSNEVTFVEGLVNSKLMTPKDMAMTNSDGNTAFCMAAIFGNKTDLLQTMIKRNKNLPQIRGHDDMLPVHLAALNGPREIVQDLSAKDKLEKMSPKDIERLFLMTVSSSMYDVATELFEEYPDRLATARDDKKQTALHILVRKPSQFDMHDDKKEVASSRSSDKSLLKLLQKLSHHIRRLEYKIALDLMTTPSNVLFEAVKSGKFYIVRCLLYENPALLEQRESNGRNLLHIAALHRQLDIFCLILTTGAANHLKLEVDNGRNNVLHFAAQLSSKERSSKNLRPSIQLEEEWRWFEQVKKKVDPKLEKMRNNKGETPQDTFSADHEELLEKAQKTAEGIAEPCMLMATLIATVVFPAALTVPGGDSTNKWFMPFVFANAVALSTACASIMILLTIYTSSWLPENESFIWLNARLTFGLRSLYISVDAMIIALILASCMIFQQHWAPVVVLALSLPAFVVSSYLQFAAVRHALQTLMVIAGKRDTQKLKNIILRK